MKILFQTCFEILIFKNPNELVYVLIFHMRSNLERVLCIRAKLNCEKSKHGQSFHSLKSSFQNILKINKFQS